MSHVGAAHLFNQAWKLVLTADRVLANTIKTTYASNLGVDVVGKVMAIIQKAPGLANKIPAGKIKTFCERLVYSHSKANPGAVALVQGLLQGVRPLIRSRL